MENTPRHIKLYNLMKKGNVHRYKKGDMITNTDDASSVWYVDRGFVKRYSISNNGSIRIQAIYEDNDIFPLTYMFKKLEQQAIYIGNETFYYEAMNNCRLYRVSGEGLATACGEDPGLFEDLFYVSGQRFLSNIQQLENVGLPGAYQRIAHTLLFYARKRGNKNKDEILVTVPFTQQDMADLLSLTRETVSASASRLKSEGVVEIKNKKVIIPDINRLAEIAYGSD